MQVHLEVVRELDRLENECQPDVRLSSITFQFADVLYGVPQSMCLSIENVGAVLAKWRFIAKMGAPDGALCAPWLSVAPLSGLLLPKQKIDISLRVHVSNQSASALSVDPNMDDILILHLENGRDHFVCVFALLAFPLVSASFVFLTCLRFCLTHKMLAGTSTLKITFAHAQTQLLYRTFIISLFIAIAHG